MKRTVSGRAFIDGKLQRNVSVEIEGSRIVDIGTDANAGDDLLILPGFIDVHVHGGAGSDFMDATTEAVATVTAFHARHGTTALAATTLSAPNMKLKHALRSITSHTMAPPDQSAEIIAIHLEGPFINQKYAGAQNRDAIRPGTVRELEQLISIIGKLPLIVTFAPEVEGALELITAFRDRVVFSIGHSAATYAQGIAAVEAGARHFTHLFNAMTPLHHREPGLIGAALVSPEATVELIADGHHIHKAVLRVFAQLLHSRAMLITDAMRACGMPDGSYKLFEHDVTVADGAARLADGTLAGSVLTMFDAVKNMIELAGLPLEQVVPLATAIPAHRLGVATRKGRIERGYDADLVLMTSDFQLKQVIARGVDVL